MTFGINRNPYDYCDRYLDDDENKIVFVVYKHELTMYGDLPDPKMKTWVKWIVDAYGFLLRQHNGEYTPETFADMIELAYDCKDNLKNRTAVKILRQLNKEDE